jgi:beta-lactamase regulating signal transducer with metallopeptidase domain
MTAGIFNAIAQSSAERLVNASLEGLLIAALVWAVLRLVPRQNAGTRFSLWMAALLSIASLPVAEALARVDRSLAGVSHAVLSIPASLGTALFVTWAVIAFLLLARVGLGVWQLRKLRHNAEEVDPAALDALPRQTLAEFQRYRRVALCVSNEVSVPTAVGLFRPAVLLPSWSLNELSAADLNSVLVHELAHLRRRDDWTNLLQKLVRAILFFHPAVWWIEKRLSLEREMACDEHVLATMENPRAYAECLVSLAERGFLHRAAMLAQGAVDRIRECSTRVAQILTGVRPKTAGASRVALVSAASGSVLLLAIFAQAPNLVAVASPARSYAQVANATNTDPMAKPGLVQASWNPQKDSTPAVVRAAFGISAVTKISAAAKPDARKLGVTSDASSVRKNPAIQPAATLRSAPGLYRTGFRQPQASAAPEAFVVFRETALYSDGSQVWAVSIYRIAVLHPHAIASNDSRKAI